MRGFVELMNHIWGLECLRNRKMGYLSKKLGSAPQKVLKLVVVVEPLERGRLSIKCLNIWTTTKGFSNYVFLRRHNEWVSKGKNKLVTPPLNSIILEI